MSSTKPWNALAAEKFMDEVAVGGKRMRKKRPAKVCILRTFIALPFVDGPDVDVACR